MLLTMALARKILVDEKVTPYYHCISRCVRRAFLCGKDPLTRRNFDHRKVWVIERLRFLGQVFAVDVCAFSVLSNHMHLVLRLAPERATSWSDDEVAARWARLFATTARVAASLPPKARQKRIALWRSRLCSLSWFMRCLNEHIARRANREDDCTGRFWEGRFYSQALLDVGALLTCMTYVELNPLRAGAVKTLSDARFTSIWHRREEMRKGFVSDWLAPFADQTEASGPGNNSDSLPFAWTDYAGLVEAAAAGVFADRDSIEGPSRAFLGRVGLNADQFGSLVRNFSRSFFGMVGHVQLIRVRLSERGAVRCRSTRGAEALYLDSPAPPHFRQVA